MNVGAVLLLLALVVVSTTIAACSGADSERGDRTSTATPSREARSRYEDGRYQATGSYGGLPSSIDVEVRLEGGVITAVDVTPNATDATSLDYQERFADAIPDVVVGRPIDDVEVSRVAGSSGTPDGFNEAIDRIRTEASR